MTSIQKLSENAQYSDSDKFHHLYVWSDLPLSEFQPSFIERIVSDCVLRFRGHHQHTAKILLFSSINPNQHGEFKVTLEDIETLSLKRGFGNGILYLAPGKNEDIFTDPVMKVNRPHSILNSSTLVEGLSERLEQLNLKDQRIVQGLRYVLHESTVDLVDGSAFAILADCWTGTWAESKEVDGEQVMS